MQQIINLWRQIISKVVIFEESKEFLFFENDIILDNPCSFLYFKKDLIKFSEDKGNYFKLNLLSRMRNNFHRKITLSPQPDLQLTNNEFLEISFNFIEFFQKRNKIYNLIFGISFLMEIYKIQINFSFNEDLNRMLKFLCYPNISKIGINFLKSFINLDSLKSSTEIIDFENWLTIILNHRKIDEVLGIYKSLFLLEQLASIGVLANNYYFRSIKEEFK